jgi:hypothetical protein
LWYLPYGLYFRDCSLTLISLVRERSVGCRYSRSSSYQQSLELGFSSGTRFPLVPLVAQTVIIHFELSVCFVLIKQSNSPRFHQFSNNSLLHPVRKSRFPYTPCIVSSMHQAPGKVSGLSTNLLTHPPNLMPRRFYPRYTSYTTQDALSQEPTLISKVRIHFADFPYLHCSNRSEAFNLGALLLSTVRAHTKYDKKIKTGI